MSLTVIVQLRSQNVADDSFTEAIAVDRRRTLSEIITIVTRGSCRAPPPTQNQTLKAECCIAILLLDAEDVRKYSPQNAKLGTKIHLGEI